jgi:hypothetical protein
MPLLRSIRARDNPIQDVNTAQWPSLRTLYVGTTCLVLPPKRNTAPQIANTTPVSAVKDPNRERDPTPVHRHVPDGDRDKPIRGLHSDARQSDDDAVSLVMRISAQDHVRGISIPSTRSKRTEETKQNLESFSKLIFPLSPSFVS